MTGFLRLFQGINDRPDPTAQACIKNIAEELVEKYIQSKDQESKKLLGIFIGSSLGGAILFFSLLGLCAYAINCYYRRRNRNHYQTITASSSNDDVEWQNNDTTEQEELQEIKRHTNTAKTNEETTEGTSMLRVSH